MSRLGRVAGAAASPAPETADEIRVVQAVQSHRMLPVVAFGNGLAVVAVAVAGWRTTIDSGAVYSLAAELLLLAPAARSYLKLRGRPRPARVSSRHIRRIEIHSFLMSLTWVATIALVLRRGTFEHQALVLMMMLVLAFGSAAMLSSMPRASVVYSGPILLASAVSAVIHDVLGVAPLALLYVGAAVSLAVTVWNNWQATVESVQLAQTVRSQNETLANVSGQLAKYMSPQLYEGIFSGEQRVEIVARRKKLTVFFSDVVNFTDITDELEPEELTEVLNRYLTEMAQIADEHGANVDKFIGDSILLYFGDPSTMGVREDAFACVRMAIAMQRRMRELQQEWRRHGVARPFELRIGINTGYCTVGNFGSEDRMDYTIIGREVNLASRLESSADVGGILLSNSTYALVQDRVLAEQAQSVTVKGFPRPVTTYRLVGIYDDLEAEGRVVHLDEHGLQLTIDRQRLSHAGRAEARRALEEALAELND